MPPMRCIYILLSITINYLLYTLALKVSLKCVSLDIESSSTWSEIKLIFVSVFVLTDLGLDIEHINIVFKLFAACLKNTTTVINILNNFGYMYVSITYSHIRVYTQVLLYTTCNVIYVYILMLDNYLVFQEDEEEDDEGPKKKAKTATNSKGKAPVAKNKKK